MKVLAIHGSMRRKGNSAILCDEVLRGAKESGCETEKLEVKDLAIRDCLGCCACLSNGGHCVQKDDMEHIYDAMKSADVIIYASPIYYYTWNSTMKRVVDRSFAITNALSGKTFCLVTAMAAESEDYAELMLESFRKYIECIPGAREGGHVIGCGTNAPGDVRGTKAMGEAYALGKSLCA